MREWIARFRDWLRRDELDRELAEELRFHRQQLERDARAAGASDDDAVYVARRRLGSTQRATEAARTRWSIPWLDQRLRDVRYAMRGLRRAPGFTATVVLTLGLGIGANAAMFGIVDRLMYRPFAYLRDPARVHRVYLQWDERGRPVTAQSFEYTRYLDLQRWTTSFAQTAAFTERPLAVGVGEAARERPVAVVSASLFDFFDATPALGRFFVASEDVTPRGAPVAVLGYGFWQSAYGGRDVLGQTLYVRNVPCTIVGVAPEGFVGVADGEAPDVFMPITTFAGSTPGSAGTGYYRDYSWGWMSAMVRRKPGVTEAQATADLAHAHARSWDAQRATEPGLTPGAIAHPRAVVGALKTAAGPSAGLESKTLLWVTSVAAIVLLIACANVTNLLLARVLRRRREIALRLALGSARRRLVAEAMTESLLLAVLGCGVGLAIAQWGGVVLRRMLLPATASLDVVTDRRTLVVTLAVAVGAGLLTALGPALLATRHDLGVALKEGVREGTYQRSRLRSMLLVLQGALSVVLLVGAGLFVRSVTRVRAKSLGYDSAPVLLVSQELRGMAMSDTARMQLAARVLEAAQAIPGVERAATVGSVPFWSTSSTKLVVPGIDSVRKLGRFTYENASADYFAVMRTRIVRGRPLGAEDRDGAPRVAVVSESMGRVLWPGRDPVGQCIRVGAGADTLPCTTVVGVAEDAVQSSLTDDAHLQYYLPLAQFHWAEGRALLLRMRGDPAAQMDRVRRALQRVMPGQSYVTVQPFQEVVDEQRRSWSLGATMFVAFGGLALVVAAVGLYGVIAYNVVQRRHELSVRVALGARARDVVRLVVGQGLSFAAAGVTIGLGGALVAARWIQPLLFEQPARDPMTYGVVGALIVLVAIAASAVPAWRATRSDPNAALRSS
ncbi:MAG: ABC transporter permease [Gemmatirosa sp.]|nr:ABC transporter permease [Gemmatirosa sp.]